MTTALVEQQHDTAELRKSRGAFFTPDLVCDFISDWAIRSPKDRVLEPSCGEAAFMLAASRRLGALGATPSAMRIDGSEIHAASARTAKASLAQRGVRSRVSTGDFLATTPTPSYDVVMGNPPYVRFHDFSGDARNIAIQAALRQGVHLSRLASSWAAFVVHSTAYLSPEGRLGFVLPAELLAANYASSVRRFLLERFASVRLITFERPVFPGVMTEAVLLLCEGRGSTDHFEVHQLRSTRDLAHLPTSSLYHPPTLGEKWTGALVHGGEAQVTLDRLTSSASFGLLDDWGRVALGAVTGNNGYFLLTPAEADNMGLAADELVRTSPPGSRHLRGIRLTPSRIASLGRQGEATLMFRPSDQPSRAALAYIRKGEAAGVQEAYKCRVRSPWWRVPLVAVPDLFITCMNGDTPRLATNEARVRHLNSVHGLYLTDETRDLRNALAVASINSATLLGAELVGRAYGGGILKLEPSEALRLPLPSPALVARHRDELEALAPGLQKLLAAGRLLDAVAEVDVVLLRRTRLLKAGQLSSLRIARGHLAARRRARGSSGRK